METYLTTLVEQIARTYPSQKARKDFCNGQGSHHRYRPGDTMRPYH